MLSQPAPTGPYPSMVISFLGPSSGGAGLMLVDELQLLGYGDTVVPIPPGLAAAVVVATGQNTTTCNATGNLHRAAANLDAGSCIGPCVDQPYMTQANIVDKQYFDPQFQTVKSAADDTFCGDFGGALATNLDLSQGVELMAPFCEDQRGCWVSARNMNVPPVLPPDFYFQTSCSLYGCYTLQPALPWDYFAVEWQYRAQYQTETPTLISWNNLLPGDETTINVYTTDNFCKVTLYLDTACAFDKTTTAPTLAPIFQTPLLSLPAYDIILNPENCFMTNVVTGSTTSGIITNNYIQPLGDTQFSTFCSDSSNGVTNNVVCPQYCANSQTCGAQAGCQNGCVDNYYGWGGITYGYLRECNPPGPWIPMYNQDLNSFYFPTNHPDADQNGLYNGKSVIALSAIRSIGITGNCDVLYQPPTAGPTFPPIASAPFATFSAPQSNPNFDYLAPTKCYSFASNPLTAIALEFFNPIYNVEIDVRINPEPIGANDDTVMSRAGYPEMCSFASIKFIYPTGIATYVSPGPVQLAQDTAGQLLAVWFNLGNVPQPLFSSCTNVIACDHCPIPQPVSYQWFPLVFDPFINFFQQYFSPCLEPPDNQDPNAPPSQACQPPPQVRVNFLAGNGSAWTWWPLSQLESTDPLAFTNLSARIDLPGYHTFWDMDQCIVISQYTVPPQYYTGLFPVLHPLTRQMYAACRATFSASTTRLNI